MHPPTSEHLMNISTIRNAVTHLLPKGQDFLCDIMHFPSTPGQEHDLMLFLDEAFGALPVDVEKVPMSDALRDDPDYSTPVPDITYDGRFNLRVVRKGTGGGRSMLFNAHTDVVPPSEGMDAPWDPKVIDGTVFGRGACDDKGQVAAFYLLLKTLDRLGLRLKGDVIGHLVTEEENGGNGSLAMTRNGEQADACIVLEPCAGGVLTSIRGAVWFRLVFTGKAGHSGQAGKTRSALLMARDAIGILEQYHDDLLAASRGFALFDPYPNPMPITFGRLQAGNWPAAAPSLATLEGVLGFLPNKTKEEICAEMKQVLDDKGGDTLAGQFDLSFMYRHDCSVVPPKHALPQALLTAAGDAGVDVRIDAMTASCDAWFYNNILDIPTVVYGPGTLAVAHSKDENIRMDDIADAVTVLTATLINHCGVDS